MKLTSLKLRLTPRRELRLALLAAMEACWVYAAFALAGSLLNIAPPSAFSIFLSYWIALMAGRILPVLQIAWVRAQMIAVGLAVAAAFYLAWVEVYARQFLFDPAWMARFVSALFALPNGLNREHLIAFAVVYTFVRGLGFAQRPLTLWFIGFQFRLGIVFLFLILVASGFVRPLDLSALIVAYFFLALIAIALARIEEIGSDGPLGPRWAVTLLAAVGLVILLGLAGARVFTLQVLEDVLRLFAPVGVILAFLLTLIVIPLSFIVEWLFNLLQPLLVNAGQMLNQLLQNLQAVQRIQESEQAVETPPLIDVLLPVLKTLVVLAGLFALGAWIARALKRRMRRYERETFIREAFEDEPASALEESRRRKKNARRARNIRAENIRRIYAALVARAGEAGVPRRIAETPNEFLPRLAQAWRQQSEELDAITRAYVAVHYGEEDAAPEVVARVRAAWQRTERAIKGSGISTRR